MTGGRPPAPAGRGGQERGDWRERAVCREVDPELFFPDAERGAAAYDQVRQAIAVCRRCPVLGECRRWAVEALPVGVAGGLTAADRRALRRARPSTIASVVPEPGATRREIAVCGRAALAAGEGRAVVARRLGVTRRTVDRWAANARTARHDRAG